jgi:hypothetical protein
LARLSGVPETIEADVLEIDGSPPPAPREPVPEPAWKGMRARVLRLDRRWWPLWAILGIIVFALVAVAGVVLAMFLIAAKVLGTVVRLIAGPGSARRGSGLSRASR